jgi:hypothetical protein
MKGSICRKVVYGLISFFILLAGGMAQYGLTLLAKQSTDDFLALVFQYGNPAIVLMWNSIIMSTLIFVTERERNETKTEDDAVLVVKLTTLQFLNAGIFVVATKIAASYDTFDAGNGIVGQISLIMILNAITPNILLFIKKYFEIFSRFEMWLTKHGWLIRSQ